MVRNVALQLLEAPQEPFFVLDYLGKVSLPKPSSKTWKLPSQKFHFSSVLISWPCLVILRPTRAEGRKWGKISHLPPPTRFPSLSYNQKMSPPMGNAFLCVSSVPIKAENHGISSARIHNEKSSEQIHKNDLFDKTIYQEKTGQRTKQNK